MFWLETSISGLTCGYTSIILSVNELETEGRLAIESPTTPITVAPDTFDLGKRGMYFVLLLLFFFNVFSIIIFYDKSLL